MRPAVFLDRDGTIIEERGYLDRLDLLELYSFTADAIRLLNRAGYATVVVTNQGGIGRGIIDEPFLQLVHSTLDSRLGTRGSIATITVRTIPTPSFRNCVRSAAAGNLHPG